MSYLDNLENNLKALENQEERDPQKVKREQERREAERSEALLRAPYVDALKNSTFTLDLIDAVPRDRASTARPGTVHLAGRDAAAGRQGEAHAADADERGDHGGILRERRRDGPDKVIPKWTTRRRWHGAGFYKFSTINNAPRVSRCDARAWPAMM